MSYVMVGSAAITVVGGIISSSGAKSRARAAAREKARLQAKLTGLENSRQAITDPYASIQDLSAIAKDLSGMITNPFANLGVATQAAKFEAEQQDISLANTLDTLKETGASAGGATALAQAALQGKKGISANIEQQEAQNEKLRAQGEQEMERMKMSEAQRIQNVQMSEGARVQGARAQGAAFVFGAKENREQDQIDRVAAQLGGAAAAEGQARADQTSAITGMIGGLTSIAGSALSSGAFSSGGASSPIAESVNNIGLTPAGLTPISGGATMTTNLMPGSDRRLKYDIINIGKSNSGLNIYSFKYKDEKFGKGLFQGVMSDEVPANAIIKGSDGYDRVNYSLLDVEFKQI